MYALSVCLLLFTMIWQYLSCPLAPSSVCVLDVHVVLKMPEIRRSICRLETFRIHRIYHLRRSKNQFGYQLYLVCQKSLQYLQMTKTWSQGNEIPFLQMLRHRHLKVNQGILIGHSTIVLLVDMAAAEAEAVVGNSERVCKRSVNDEG